MKKLLALAAVVGSAFTLTACDLNNDEMENIISKCKEDKECKEILDREIDEALAERGIFGNQEEEFDFDVFYDLDLSEEELSLIDTLEALDEELWTKLDSMTDDEIKAFELSEMEKMLGRALTDDEKAALDLIETIEFVEEDVMYVEEPVGDQEFDTEQAYLEFYLGRELTQTELDALATIENLFNDETIQEDFVLTEEQENAFDILDALYEDVFKASEVHELEVLLERQLTEVELNALNVIYTLDFDDESELSNEQLQALEQIDNLYDEAYSNYEDPFYASLTDDEKAALDTVDALYEEMYSNFDESEDSYVADMVSYYESILGRELTTQEKDAIEFSLEFYFCEDCFMEDEYDFDDFDYEDIIDEDFVEIN